MDRPRRVASIAVRAGGRVEARVVAPAGTAAPPGDPRFLLYSVTKTFLAAAALRLVASGELALDQPLSRWLPAAPHGNAITLRHLLQHTSGLPDYGGLPDYHRAVRRCDRPWAPAEFLERSGAARLLFEPGHGFAYSNVGYLLVWMLLEAARGASLATVLRDEVLAPLGLARTALAGDDDLPRLTFGPSRDLGAGAAVDVAARYHVGWVAHRVLLSTASDVALFLERLVEPAFLPESCREQLLRPRPVGSAPTRGFRRPAYALGLQADLDRRRPVVGHSGGGPGATTAVYRRAGKEPRTVAVLSADEEDATAEAMALELLARQPR